MIFPVPVALNLFAAPRLVFSLGISTSSILQIEMKNPSLPRNVSFYREPSPYFKHKLTAMAKGIVTSFRGTDFISLGDKKHRHSPSFPRRGLLDSPYVPNILSDPLEE